MQRNVRINWLAILAGNVLDTFLSTIIALIGFGIFPDVPFDGYFASASGAIIGLSLMLATVISGWLAGRIAKQERFLHGFLVGGIGIIVMLIAGLAERPARLDEIVLQCVGTLLAGLAGYSSRWTPARQRGK